jgi:hypothetical protein
MFPDQQRCFAISFVSESRMWGSSSMITARIIKSGKKKPDKNKKFQGTAQGRSAVTDIRMDSRCFAGGGLKFIPTFVFFALRSIDLFCLLRLR